ncbi:BfmA/BtgA family mobilization protein [Hymenobacter bucti]|uniref:BfmA/BtgA family mobilization protein n=1 Tax=Hymenobacter bucti TaxID=1844114 RepID=A0ABW4R0V6_9BACT
MPSNPEMKSVNVPTAVHKLLSEEAKRLGVSQGEYAAASVSYFAKRKLNPLDNDAREGQLIMQQVKKLGDRVFSYLQEEERSLLIPMLEEMLRTRITIDRLLRMNEILVNRLTQQLSVYTEQQLAVQRESLKKLRQQNEEMIEQQVNDALTNARGAGHGKANAGGSRRKTTYD